MPEGLARPVRVMLVEDHAAFHRALATLVDREPDLAVVAQAGAPDEARRHAASVGFDVAVMDLGFPDGDGEALIGELRRAASGAALPILSNSLDPTNLKRATEAGADEVLPKFAAPGEIIGTIRRLGSG
ncbi:response regulator [Rubrobacter marinus]|uniref:Response regulator n=1 Tax=Rubrobacter marinus TaxID=2653852 RepID=A0A6G8PV27_9ACTN|nr:response regulator transcription factor [Rubrobacter marinus]QIN78044.1 response regulator [Rubrobacter marinus]